MKRAFLLTIGGVVALLLATGASAATTSGKVVSTDALGNAFTIQTDDGRRFVFTTNDTTKIEHAGATLALEDLPVDSRVTVTTDMAPSDPASRLAATQVQVDQMSAAATPSETRSEPPMTTARAESAGERGGELERTAEVESAERERLPRTATPLPLIAVLGAASLGVGVLLGLRRR